MVGFAEIVLIAAVTQLAVLPGEKVQFIIAGLSTRYPPWLVVSAAGSAFAGWTAVEILFGEAIQGALPGAVLDAFTAGLFLLFAVLLVRSAPDRGESEPTTDGGEAVELDTRVDVFGHTIGGRLGEFLTIFAMMAAGEFGDKTQVVTIGLAVQYGATPAIWLGEMLAIIPVSLANAYFFNRFSHRFDVRKAHYAGAAVFVFFGLDTVLQLLTDVSIWEEIVSTLSDAVFALA